MSGKKNILVTGGAGYIGSHTVVELIAKGYEPVILDNFSNARPVILSRIEAITGTAIPCEEGDCTDPVFLRSLFKKYTFAGVIHFAAFKAVNESVKEPLAYYHNNLSGLIYLLEVMQEFGVDQLVFSSSCTVYGTPVGTRTVDESTPLGTPNSPYGWTKWMCEQIIRDTVVASLQLKVVLLRYFNPVGAHESGLIGEWPQGTPNNILPYITQTAAGKLEQLTVFGDDYDTPDGTCIRDFIHVADLADAHIKALEYLDTNSELAVFNLGTGKGTSVLELIHAFEQVSGKPLSWKFGPRRAGDVVEICADVERARTILKWEAKRTVVDAVKDSWNWEQKRIADGL